MKYKLINKTNPLFSTMQQVLYNRGIPTDLMMRYMKTTMRDEHHYSLFGEDIIKARELIVETLQKKEGLIYVQVDSDCDGFTASSEFINYLTDLGYGDRIIYGIHPGKEHGFDIDSFMEAGLDKKVILVVIPDAGSNEYEKHAKMKELGIPMLIIDHHHAEKKTEDAVILNNQLCDYPNKELSGVGVVYKLCQALDDWFGYSYSERYLDLVAVGMTADMMSLRDLETKYLINAGLLNIKNQFLRALFDKQAYQLRDGITSFGVGFYIAPVINAVIRTGTVADKKVMFEAMLDVNANKEVLSTKRGHKQGEMELLTNQAVRMAANLQRKQKDQRDAAMMAVIEKIETEELYKNKILLVDVSELEIPKTLTGLIANQIVSRYQQPVLLLRKTDKGMLEGSGRGYEKSELKDTREFLQYTGCVEYAEGHGNAFGTGIKLDKVEEFLEECNKELKDMTFEPVYLVDFVWEGNQIQADTILEIAAGKNLWGKDMDEPQVVLKNLKIEKGKANVSLLSPDKNPTLKIETNGITLIKFKSSKEEYDSFNVDGEIFIDILGKCKENEWNSKIEAQMIIQDYEMRVVKQDRPAMKWVF